MAASTHYRANASNVQDETLADFVKSKLSNDLRDVPGIGPANEKLLVAEGIECPRQLLGQFLLLGKPDDSIQEHCDKFYQWLKDIGIKSGRATIIRSLGQKLSTMIPGSYDDEEVDQ